MLGLARCGSRRGSFMLVLEDTNIGVDRARVYDGRRWGDEVKWAGKGIPWPRNVSNFVSGKDTKS